MEDRVHLRNTMGLFPPQEEAGEALHDLPSAASETQVFVTNIPSDALEQMSK